MSGEILTPSQVESYLNCPWETYLERKCGYVPRPVIGNQIGSACHEFVAGLHKPKYSFVGSYQHTAPRLSPEWLSAEWIQFWTGHLRKIKRSVDRLTLDDFYQQGLKDGPKWIQKYLERHAVLDLHPDKVEFAFRTTHIPETSVWLNVRVDQIRPHRERPEEDVLVDLKFSHHNDFDPYTNLALRCYALVYRLNYKRNEAGVAIWNVPYGQSGRKFSVYSEGEMEETVNLLRKVGLRIKRRQWNVPDGAPHCRDCQTKEMCTKPHTSIELISLACRNRNYVGPLPKTRTGIIESRLLELPTDGGPANQYKQTELSLDIPQS